MQVFSGILAGGSGTRLGHTEQPKQFLKLGRKPVFIHTLEKFLINNAIEHHFVGVPGAWLNYAREVIDKSIDGSLACKLSLVEGGVTRNETIIKIIEAIEDKYGAHNNILITHDSVRPFVNTKTINDNIRFGKTEVAVDTVIPAVDTIIQSIDGQSIIDIPTRAEMYRGQTPQTFLTETFKKLYCQLDDAQKELLSDAIKVFTLAGVDVKIVLGDERNIKITTQHDFQLARFLLGYQHQDD